MSVRTPSRGSLPTSRKRAVSRAVVLALCSATALLLCWAILKPGTETTLQDPALASQQSRVVRFRLEVAFPSCLTVYIQCSPSALSWRFAELKKALEAVGSSWKGLPGNVPLHQGAPLLRFTTKVDMPHRQTHKFGSNCCNVLYRTSTATCGSGSPIT